MLWRMISQTQAKSPDLPPREMFEVDSHFKGDTEYYSVVIPHKDSLTLIVVRVVPLKVSTP